MDQFLLEGLGYAGTACTIASYSMRTIIPLRIVGILSSVFFIAYGFVLQSVPIILMEVCLLPLNTFRLFQIIRLVRQAEEAARSDFSLDWLKPFARDERRDTGDTVFAAGQKADYLLIVRSGQFRLREAGIDLKHGDIVGELGFLSPDNRRTMTLDCIAEGTVSRVSYSALKQLYFQNPRFGFAFLRLISERLFQNIERAKAGETEGALVAGLSRPVAIAAAPESR